MKRLHLTACLVTLFLAAVTVAFPSPTSAQAQREGFVGRVDGTNALIAIVVEGSHITGYVCDGESISSWVRGDSATGSALLTGSDDVRVVVSSTQGAPWGAIHANGRTHAFTTEALSGEAALYRAEGGNDDVTYIGGWIVAANGDVRGTAVVTNVQNGSRNTIRDGNSTTNVPGGGNTGLNTQNLQANIPGAGLVVIAEIVSPRDPASIR